MKKKKNKKQNILTFPKQLTRESYFACPIWWADEPSFVNKLNKASDPYIEQSKKLLKKEINERNKKFGNKGDAGKVFHSTTLINDPWPIYLDPTGKQGQAGIQVDLKQGDMLIYSGCDLEHWREEFTGKDCGQVFLHYNKKSSKNYKENQYDKRPFIGLPAWYKGFKK